MRAVARIAARVIAIAGLASTGYMTEVTVPARVRTIGYRAGWPVNVGLLVDRSSPTAGDLDHDSDLEVVAGTVGHKVYAVNPDGSSVAGWPVTVSAEVNSSAAIGDINGDGWNEVVVGVGWADLQNDGGIYAFSHDGSVLPGWPVRTQDNNLGPDGHPDGVFASPALADLDGDGLLEVVVSGFDQYLYALNHDGSAVEGWPFFLWDGSWSSAAVADLDGDGEVEIVIGAYTHSGHPPGLPTVDGGGIVWVLNADGSPVPGWPRVFSLHFDSSPALGDLDGDGDLEIVIGTGQEVGSTAGRHVYAWHHDGSDVHGWPVATQDYVWPSPAVGDLDGDGDHEVVISCADGLLYAWDGGGHSLSGWPVRPLNESGLNGPMVGSPVIADLNSDHNPEVMVPIGWDLVAFNRDGSPFRYGSESQLRLHTLFSIGGTPAIMDIDGNDRLDVLVGSAQSAYSQGRLYAWELPSSAVPGTEPWPMFRHDAYRTGRGVVLPRLLISPESLLVLHQDGSGSSETSYLWVSNHGDGTIDWQVDSKPPEATLTPDSGTVGRQGRKVTVEISVGVKGPGLHELGDIAISAIGEGAAVPGSPATIPVTLYVGDVHHAFLPLALRQY